MKRSVTKKLIEKGIFEARWILVFFYYGLIAAILVYAFVYSKSTYHLVRDVGVLTNEGIMLAALELLDMVMVANLIDYLMKGSYNSFVSKDHGYKNANITSGTLKVKMSTSLIGVSSIHLLQTFIHSAESKRDVWTELLPQLIIHGAFILGAMGLTWINLVQAKAELLELEVEQKEEEKEHSHQTSH